MTLPGADLSASDLARLAACGITAELAAAAGLRRVTSQEGAAIVGRNGSGDYAGILFPYVWPGESGPREFRLRLDHPPIEYDSEGRPKERGKYLSPPGRGNLLYWAPGTDAEWLQDASLPVVVVEGEKKTLSLWSVALHALGDTADRPRFLPIGLSGVYNWRGSTGKTTGPDGTRRDVKGPIPDLQRVAWRGRKVTICFDLNVTSNESVQAARFQLTQELRKRGAVLHWFVWPEDTPAGINGIDDLIGAWGPDRVLVLVEGARPVKVTTRDQQASTREFSGSDGHYRLALPAIGVVFDADRLRREHQELVGELCVRCDLPGARTIDGTLSIADFNLSSARARSERAKLLSERSNAADLDWIGALEEFCQRVLAADRTGQPSVTMGKPDPNYRRDLMYNVDGLMLLQRHPTILFGGPGTNKSYIALRALGKLSEQGKSVLYLDWELDLSDHEYRLSELFPDGIPPVEYMRCYRPLTGEVDRIQHAVREKRIDYIAYDSVGFACGGAPESAEVALAYFRAVREIGPGSLHIAHNAKGEGNDQEPFGSRFWKANARQMWFAGADESTINPKMVALFCRKANLDKLFPPVTYRIEWTDSGTCEFSRANITDSAELSGKLSVREQIYQLLRSGPRTVTQISEETGIETNTVTQTINRYVRKNKVFIVLDGENTNRRIGLLARDTCHDSIS